MSSNHQRIHEALIAHWQALRGDRAYPAENEVDPEKLVDIWDSCFLIQVTGGNRFHYAYLGKSLIEAYGDDLTSRDVPDRLIEAGSAAMAHKCCDVVQNATQVTDESEFVNSLGMRIKYRSCLLPLGEKPGAVNYILGAMRWKAF